jgi:hypothetical protein
MGAAHAKQPRRASLHRRRHHHIVRPRADDDDVADAGDAGGNCGHQE